MSGSRKLIDELERQIAVSAASRRPPLKLVVETLRDAMDGIPGGGAVPELDGPDIWTWVDARGKVYAVAPSPDRDGHPMLTIRQPVTKELGLWITTTSLVLGDDRASILHSATVAIIGHSGAYAGYQATITAVAASGDPMDGIRKACEIADRDPTVNSAIASVVRDSDKDKGPEGMN